jgi:hypothetical protein
VRKILRASAVTAAVALLLAPFAVGTPEFSKKEKKQCTYCHTAMGKPDLNEAGRYYRDHNYSLDGYDKKKP